MDKSLLQKHIKDYLRHLMEEPERHQKDIAERKDRIDYYQAWTKERILHMDEEQLYEYIARLWAMLIWGNKHYVVTKLINDNSLPKVKDQLANLVWGSAPVDQRWDEFRTRIKGVGPAMMSEILCFSHPEECAIWNRRAFMGLEYLGVNNLPRYNYQLNGKKYAEISELMKSIAGEMRNAEVHDVNLLTVDYFIWDELQVKDNLSQLFSKSKEKELESSIEPVDKATSDFIHNEVRDKLAEIGTWLGFNAKTEIKVADGSKVDAVWESTIGNMGRVIYVFEVQTKGSIDSLILNLLKAMNNSAVQGVVAVSDTAQLETIRKHAANVGDLNKKLKYWDYKEVLQIHEYLEAVNASINSLGLVPQGF